MNFALFTCPETVCILKTASSRVLKYISSYNSTYLELLKLAAGQAFDPLRSFISGYFKTLTNASAVSTFQVCYF